MSKRLISVIDGSEFRTDVSKRVVNTVKLGRCHSETKRDVKIVEFAFFVEIDAKVGITHTLERKRVRDALRAKMSGTFDDVRRRSDGTYIFNEPRQAFEFVAKLEDGSSVHLGTDKNAAAKRAAKLAISRETRVVELMKEAA